MRNLGYISLCAHLSEVFEKGSEALESSQYEHLSFLRKVADTGHVLARQKYITKALLDNSSCKLYLPFEVERLLCIMAREQRYNNKQTHCTSLSRETLMLLQIINLNEFNKNQVKPLPGNFKAKRDSVSQVFIQSESVMVQLLAPLMLSLDQIS